MDNLTDGLLTDAEAHAVAVAAVRRGAGEGWAARHFRYDIVNSNVLGPPGLNGTVDYMRQRQAAGVVVLECPQRISDTVAVGVIALPPELAIQNPRLGFTRVIVVHARRSTGASCVQVFGNGRREPIPYKPKGELSWQLDTGELQTLPIAGSVWYQARGWSCHPADQTVTGNLCAMVRP